MAQRVCSKSKACRQQRRRAQAQATRALNLPHFRKLERARQEKCRLKACREEGRDAGPSRATLASVSRATLSPEVLPIIRVALEIWDEIWGQQAMASRARLAEELTRRTGVFQQFPGAGVGESVGGA